MKQTFRMNIEIDKEYPIPQVSDWMNDTIKGSKVNEVRIYNLDLIFDGTLDAYLGEIDVFSSEGVSKEELTQLFKSHPPFIHRIVFREVIVTK